MVIEYTVARNATLSKRAPHCALEKLNTNAYEGFFNHMAITVHQDGEGGRSMMSEGRWKMEDGRCLMFDGRWKREDV